MTITNHAPRAMPARGAIPTPAAAVPGAPRPAGGLSAGEIRQIVLEILG